MRISDWSSDVCSSDLEASRHNVSYDPAFFDNISIGSRVKSRHLRPIFDHHLPSAQIMALILKNVIPCPLGSGGLCSEFRQIGRAYVLTPVTNALIVCRLLLEKINKLDMTQSIKAPSHKHK